MGTAMFTYTNLDNNGNLSNTATVTIPILNNPPIATNINNPAISRSAPATSLTPLSSTDLDGTIQSYVIHTVPTVEEGVLRVCTSAPSTGCTVVTAGQVLTPTQVTQLAFTPEYWNHSPVVTFLYSTIDNNGNVSNVAASNIPMFDVLPLPIDLLEFGAVRQGNDAMVTWKTGEEELGIKYQLQHNIDGQSWSTVNTQDALNNGQSGNMYSFLHNNLSKGIHFYRLKISDLDGTSSFSPTRSLRMDAEQAYNVLFYPNPATDKFTITTTDASVMNEVSIFNNQGTLIQQFNQVKSGTVVYLNNYAPGFYIIKIKDKNGEMQVVKLTKK